ncbi:MAG: hypothetical protein AAF636_10195 [Pseudomonadota bacterium]
MHFAAERKKQTHGGLFISNSALLAARSKIAFRFVRVQLPFKQQFGLASIVAVHTTQTLKTAITTAGFWIVESCHTDGLTLARFVVARKR